MYSSRLLIVLYSPNGVRVQTNTNGIQILRENNIPGGTNEYKRNTNDIQHELQKPEGSDIPGGTNEYKRSTSGAQTEYKNPRGTTSQAVQTNTSGAKEEGEDLGAEEEEEEEEVEEDGDGGG